MRFLQLICNMYDRIKAHLNSGKLSFEESLPLLAKLNQLKGNKFPFLKKAPPKLQYGKSNYSTVMLHEHVAATEAVDSTPDSAFDDNG